MLEKKLRDIYWIHSFHCVQQCNAAAVPFMGIDTVREKQFQYLRLISGRRYMEQCPVFGVPHLGIGIVRKQKLRYLHRIPIYRLVQQGLINIFPRFRDFQII